ncbi:hypothetical protein [Agrobacterium pusense]|uniref:hypothetical protein n=1 Tax=Agrobacterium pusense TaxID=648995 RepID=UPI00289BA0B8|nr:hypothetical protein [Agrobacterium pusense]
MSDNPAAFDALRCVAYDFVKRHGKDPVSLEGACRDFMSISKADGSLGDISDVDVKRLIDDVVRWTIRKYNPPKRRPERHREERAATMILAPEFLEIASERYGKATVRNAARVSGQSKSTLARHLARQGISPRREAKIKQLPANTQKLLRILDETFDRRAEGVLRVAELLEAIWEASASGLPRSTLASRRKALGTMLAVVAKSNLGYHSVTKGDFVAVRRGRNFRSLSEAVVRIEDDCRNNRFVSVVVPRAIDKILFWNDPYILHMLEILEMSATEHFYPPERLNSIFFFKRPLIDLTPLLPWLHRAHFSDYSSSIGYNLALLGEKILDPTVRKAASQVSMQLQMLVGYCGPFRICVDAFDMVDYILDVMSHAKQYAPGSFCRLSYLRASLENRDETYEELREELRGMLALEQSGEWQAPDEQTLRCYLPEH